MEIYAWIAFLVFVLGMLALDLGVFHRGDRAIPIREALAWSAFWFVLALGFGALIHASYQHHWLGFGTYGPEADTGREALVQYITAYVVEKSLSIDNIFVIAMIFAYFAVPLELQHRVLFWGILGALVLRGIMIAAGALLMARFQWVVYVFGILLLATAVKLLITRHDNQSLDSNPVVRLVRRFLPVTDGFRGHHFLVREAGKWAITPLGLCLLVVESSDVLFAIDSIPAVFAITRDPFLVFTSNVFALLGLRSLYFALAGMMHRFRYLKNSLVFLLAFIGVKMLLSHHHPIPNVVSLAVIAGILSVGIAASLIASRTDPVALGSPLGPELVRLGQFGLRQLWRVVILIVGSTVLLLGIVMIILPGPALLVIPAGLAILALELAWARRWLARFREGAGRAWEKRPWRDSEPGSATQEPKQESDHQHHGTQ